MKMKIALGIIFAIIVLVGGIRLVGHLLKDDGGPTQVITPVEVVRIDEEAIEDILSYQGVVMPLAIERISFKSSGRVAAYGGEIGDMLQAGDELVSLETKDLELSLEAAKNQVLAASADYDRANKGTRPEDISLASISANKASEAVDYLMDQVSDVVALYEEGVVSESELEGLKLELTLAQSDYALAEQNYQKALNGAEVEIVQAAQAQLALALTNREVQQMMLEDAVHILDEPKVIVDKLYEPGELVSAGYPVAIVRSIDQSVTVGVTRKDIVNIDVGGRVHVNLFDQIVDGEVIRVAQVPDTTHFLYEVEISLPDEAYVVGEIVTCEFVLGERKVIRIPITALMNDGIDYVFLEKDGLVVIRQVVVEEIVSGYAIVSGLDIGDRMITSNLNRISENSMILVEE